MPRPSEIEATATKLHPDVPARTTVYRLLREHETMSNVASILGVSVSALFRYVEKNQIEKKTCWVDKLPN